MTDTEALKALVEACEKEFCSPATERGELVSADDESVMGPGECPITFGKIRAARAAIERMLASQDKPEAEAVLGSSVCPICGKDSPHYHKPEEATMYNAKFVGVGPQFVQDALQHVYAAMDAMRRKGARENYDRGYNAGFNVSADILEAALKDIKAKLGWMAERTGEFPPIVFDAEAAANRPLPSDKLRGLVRKWLEEKPVAYMHYVMEIEALLSQEPSSGEGAK